MLAEFPRPRVPDGTLTVLVLGASGRLGRFLAAAWAAAPPEGVAVRWQWRRGAGGAGGPDRVIWDPLAAPVPEGAGPVDVVLDLAGVVRGAPQDLARNTDLARAAWDAGLALGARHVFLPSTGAVYGRGTGAWSEADPPAPESDYARAKLEMERAARGWAAVPGAPGLTCLRMGNVAGADALLAPLGRDPAREVVLDRFADGQGPRRAYIGPLGLAAQLARLVRRAGQGAPLPEVLNLAAPGVVAMADLLAAAGVHWHWRPAPEGALPELALDLGRLHALCPPAPSGAAAMVDEWRALRGALE